MVTRKRSKPKQPNAAEQSGSTGRRAADGPQRDKDSGQDRYGQSGFAGRETETEGQARYRRSGARVPAPKHKATRKQG